MPRRRTSIKRNITPLSERGPPPGIIAFQEEDSLYERFKKQRGKHPRLLNHIKR